MRCVMAGCGQPARLGLSQDPGPRSCKSVLALLPVGIYARTIMRRHLWMLGVLLLRALRLRRLHWLLSLQGCLLLWWSLAVPLEVHRLDADAWRGEQWMRSVPLLFWLEALIGSWRSPAQENAERVSQQSALGELSGWASPWAWLSTLAPLLWLLLFAGGGTWLLAELLHPHFEPEHRILLGWLGQLLFWCVALRCVQSSRLSLLWQRALLLLLGLALLLLYPADRAGTLPAWLAALCFLAALALLLSAETGRFHVEPASPAVDVPRGTASKEHGSSSQASVGDERC